MDAILSRGTNLSAKTQVRPAELIEIFHHYANHIEVLSLDCFDTLLWRRTVQPFDVFYDLQHKPTFKECGITAGQRVNAERYARHTLFARQQIFEVTLQQIYQIGFPLLAEAHYERLIEEEIAAEIENCYGFPAIIELIRVAHAMNKKIIIVSNTYLQEAQLRRLLHHALPPDVVQAIHKIFCSCEFLRSKADGLFQDILQKLSVPANKILHIGDNKESDFASPRALGVHALHFLQFDPRLEELFRAQAMSGLMVEPALRYTRALTNPFRGVLACADSALHQPESVVGYASLGPILYCFARYLCEEAVEMQSKGEQVKYLFMLRDGYLLAQACDVYSGKSMGQQMRISRFSAIAASFYTQEDVMEFVSYGLLNSMEVICHQLLLPQEMASMLIAIANASSMPKATFVKLLAQDNIIETILANSSIHRERLKRYLQQHCHIQPNDIVVLVDIGYSGTAQKFLTPFFMKEFGVKDVLGRYLMSMTAVGKNPKQAGLIDDAGYDERIINMLYLNCTLFEELCCKDEKSTLSYNDDLSLVTSRMDKKSDQNAKVKKIQEESLRFILDANAFFNTTAISFSSYMLRDIAMAEMSRMIYFPTHSEIEYLQGLEHDLNMGTEDLVPLVNAPQKELAQLQQQGLMFKGQQFPAGLRHAGLELSAMLLAQQKLGFDLNLEDMSLQRELVTVAGKQDQQSQQYVIPVSPTHDGYFSLWIPFQSGQNVQLSVLFGLHYKFVQLHSAQFIPMKFFLSKEEPTRAQEAWPQMKLNQMVEKGDGLFECLSPESSAMIAPVLSGNETYVFRIVFRPIVRRVNL